MVLSKQYLRVTKMMVQYYQNTPVEPTFEAWQTWIENLDEPMKSGFHKMGFEKSKTALPFIRFYSELRDFGMRDYMKKKLDREDFEYYMKNVEKR